MSSSQIATPKTPSFLLTTLFGGGGESQSRQSQNLQSSAATPTRRDVRLWTAESLRDEDEDSKVESWELHQSVPSAGYDDESFGLWIRPNERTRTVISGEDAERTEMASNIQRSGRGDADSLNAECSSESELANRKMVCAEQEDMEILEEVLDFCKDARKERGYKLYNIKNLKEYQDFVMTDIGLAIQAMNEILDQQERTRGHPDNLGRDSKPHGGQKSSLPPLSPVILPPIKNHQNVTLKGSKSTRLPRRPNPQQVPQMLSIGQTTTPENPQQQHRRRSSVSQGRPTLSSMISSIKQSLPSPSILHSPHQRQYTSYPDGTPFPSTAVPVSVPVSYSQSESTDQQQQLYQMLAQSLNSGVNVNNGGFLPQSIQNIFSSFRGSPNSPNGSSLPGHVVSPRSAPPTLTKQEEKRLHMDHRWRVDILRRRAHLRGWACRNFLALYEYSIMISSSSPTLPLALACSLEQEFKDQYRIINAIVRVDAIATAKSHEMLEAILRKSHELEKEQFKLRYNAYRTKAPTGKEIRIMNLEAVKLFEEQYTTPGIKVRRGEQNQNETNGGAIELSLDEYVAPLALVAQHIDSTASASTAATAVVNDSAKESSDVGSVSAYDFMELYGLQGHSVWEPLLDRLTKFDTTHHSLDARNVYQFLRRMSVSSPSVTLNLLSDKARDELLAVLWILERCVSERKDFQQSPTWFRMSSSASAVQELYDAGGVISYMKNLRDNDAQGRDPINIVHPVTLTGYFKRLLKDCGGLLLKEATALFVELTSPSTDNGEFWTLDKLTKIDRALLYRLICLDLNRGRVFLRISRIMEQILESSPKDMELDAFALSKMVQVVELSGVLDLKALRRWNGAWSAIILGYM
ncbi:hypothetical protein BGX28_010210 [Mortierella sp. GBA30]|nr:hypothetical protein BGX28_010210 [Mortierella sp. GBA30]